MSTLLMLVHPQGLSEADPLRHRPVRHARRQGDGLRRPALGGAGGEPAAAGHAGRHLLLARPAAAGLGRRVRPAASRGRPGLARQVVYPGGGREQVVDYLPWLTVDRAHLAAGEVVDRRARAGQSRDRAAFSSPSRGGRRHFTAADAARARSPGDRGRARCGCTPTRSRSSASFKPGSEELVLAARVTGPVKSAFGEKAPEGVDAAAAAASGRGQGARQTSSSSPTRDLLDDRNWLRASNDDGPGGDGAARRQRQLRRQRARLPGRQRRPARPARPRGDPAAVHPRRRDPPGGRAAVPGEGAGAHRQARRPAAEAEHAAGRRRRGPRAC